MDVAWSTHVTAGPGCLVASKSREATRTLKTSSPPRQPHLAPLLHQEGRITRRAESLSSEDLRTLPQE